MPRANELRQRFVVVIPLAKKNLFRFAVPDRRKTIIANQQSVKTIDFCLVEWPLTGFKNRAAPALKAIDRRALSLNLKAGATIGQQKKARSASNDLRARFTNRVFGLV